MVVFHVRRPWGGLAPHVGPANLRGQVRHKIPQDGVVQGGRLALLVLPRVARGRGPRASGAREKAGKHRIGALDRRVEGPAVPRAQGPELAVRDKDVACSPEEASARGRRVGDRA